MFEKEVVNAWKDIPKELMMKPTAAARPLLETIFNLACAINFIYKEDDQIASLLGDHLLL